jgi:predicted nucleotide-binding protein
VKVFLSWSGEKSRRVANVLRDWLPRVIQAVEPWLASSDIPPGASWSESITAALSSSDAGIICVTKSNQQSPWLNYETAALRNILPPGNVLPLLIDLSPGDLAGGPLATVQAVKIERDDITKLFTALAALANPDRPKDRLPPERPPELSDRRLEEIMISLRVAVEETSVLLNDSATALDDFVVSGAEPSQDQSSVAALESKVDKLIAAVDLLNDRVNVGHAPGPTSQATDVLPDKRPTMFIGSSAEGLHIAEAIQLELKKSVECTLWDQDMFRPGQGFFETLVDRADEFDFAVIAMTADDMLIKRGIEMRAPRDNLIFEIGLFTGKRGRGRAFVVHPSDEHIEFPSDFKGVKLIDFELERSDGNLQAAVGPACTEIKRAMGIWGGR